MDETKVSRNYRLSPQALALIDQLASRLGLSQAGVLEVAVRVLARWEAAIPPEAIGWLSSALAEAKEVEPAPSRVGRPRKPAPTAGAMPPRGRPRKEGG